MPTTFDVSMPPSVNASYRNVLGKGRVKSQVLKDFLETGGWEVLSQRVPSFDRPVAIDVVLRRPTPTSDLDNRLKALFDLLTDQHVLVPNDTLIHRITAQWGDVPNCRVTITELFS